MTEAKKESTGYGHAVFTPLLQKTDRTALNAVLYNDALNINQ